MRLPKNGSGISSSIMIAWSDTAISTARVTAVVLTHNRAQEVLRTVEHLLGLPEQPGVIVVDNGSSDETAEALAHRFPGVEVIKLPCNIGAAGRNAGVARAKSPYVALCDDDTWWAPGALPRAAEALDAYPRLAIVTGRVLIGPEGREDPACRRMAQSPLSVLGRGGLPGPPILGFLAGASVIRRAAFLQVGGFEPRLFLGGEEALVAVDLAAAGWEMCYLEDAVVHHYPSAVRDSRLRRQLLLRNGLWTHGCDAQHAAR
jgi:GT2 family glycosyltransferase